MALQNHVIIQNKIWMGQSPRGYVTKSHPVDLLWFKSD